MEGHFYVLVASPGIIDFPMFASESHFRFFTFVFSLSFFHGRFGLMNLPFAISKHKGDASRSRFSSVL